MFSDFISRHEKLTAGVASGGILAGLLALGAAPRGGEDLSPALKQEGVTTQQVDRKVPPGITTLAAPAGSPKLSDSDLRDWSSVVGAVTPSVVSIRVSSAAGGGIGSGVVLDREGFIVTNNHVVAQGGGGVINVVFTDSSVYEARVVRTDPQSDLAVIKLTTPPKNLSPMKFAATDPTVGSPVLAVGSPLGLSGTVTNGIISAVNRPVSSQDSSDLGQQGQSPTAVINALQTNAAINPGNSGGGLVNAQGELVGINSSIATTGQSNGNIGIGFAIPATTVAKITPYLKKGQAFPYGKLGVSARDGVGKEGSKGVLGAEVAEVMASSGAQEADLRAGDIIVAVNGEQVSSSSALVGRIRTFPRGNEVTLTVVRNGAARDHRVTLN